jgi:hypothetical protein
MTNFQSLHSSHRSGLVSVPIEPAPTRRSELLAAAWYPCVPGSLAGGDVFFESRAPHKAIAAFGFSQRYESMPAIYARDCCGEANGASDFRPMLARIVRLRGDCSPDAIFKPQGWMKGGTSDG